VIAVGHIHDPLLAEDILARGKADLVAMGRALLADPHLPRKALEGKEEEIRPCIGCNEGCYKHILQQLDIQCSVNPTLGRESELVVEKTPRPKKLFVVGAGPAGLEAAHAASEKGHQVVLIEKEKKLGGQLNLASVPPGRKEIERFTEFLLRRLKRSDVKVITGEADAKPLIEKERPDVLILATGAIPRKMEIPGLDKSTTLTAWEILSGEKDPKGSCLVLGAGLVGCETADYLSEKRKEVVLVEVLPEIAAGADGDTKAYFTLRFQKNGVKVHVATELLRVENEIAFLREGKEEMKVPIKAVVFAVGAQPQDPFGDELPSSGMRIIKAGDCLKPKTILESVQEGFQAGRSVQ